MKDLKDSIEQFHTIAHASNNKGMQKIVDALLLATTTPTHVCILTDEEYQLLANIERVNTLRRELSISLEPEVPDAPPDKGGITRKGL